MESKEKEVNSNRYYSNKKMTFEERMQQASQEAYDNRENTKLSIKLVEDLMGISKDDFLVSRTRNKVLSRHLLHYALRRKTTMTLEAIGSLTHLDHATVSHSIHYIEDNAQYDAYIGVLKKCIDKEVVPEVFKIRDKFLLSNNCNKGEDTKVEGIFNVIFKHIDLFQYENANILQPDKVSSKEVRKETRRNRLEREMRGA